MSILKYAVGSWGCVFIILFFAIPASMVVIPAFVDVSTPLFWVLEAGVLFVMVLAIVCGLEVAGKWDNAEAKEAKQ